jgi:hypothetical protein
MKFPAAVDPALVGEYPALAKSGGGYFFDDVLEYRVWCCPGPGEAEEANEEENDGSDYYYAFATYEEAIECAAAEPTAENRWFSSASTSGSVSRRRGCSFTSAANELLSGESSGWSVVRAYQER